jgi:hypothetical protein
VRDHGDDNEKEVVVHYEDQLKLIEAIAGRPSIIMAHL